MNSLSSVSRWTSFGGGFQNESAGVAELVVASQLNGCDDNQEARKMPPRPIGVERAWKQAAGQAVHDEWLSYSTMPPHLPPQHPHQLIHQQQPYDDLGQDRYPVINYHKKVFDNYILFNMNLSLQQMDNFGGGVLNMLPMQCYPPPVPHWDAPPHHHTPDKQQVIILVKNQIQVTCRFEFK